MHIYRSRSRALSTYLPLHKHDEVATDIVAEVSQSQQNKRANKVLSATANK